MIARPLFGGGNNQSRPPTRANKIRRVLWPNEPQEDIYYLSKDKHSSQ